MKADLPNWIKNFYEDLRPTSVEHRTYESVEHRVYELGKLVLKLEQRIKTLEDIFDSQDPL